MTLETVMEVYSYRIERFGCHESGAAFCYLLWHDRKMCVKWCGAQWEVG